MTPPNPHLPPRRADAERNRERILSAARAAFADPGTDVSMAEIARRAEVGQGTLYRNFAGRRELLEALYVDEVDALCEAAETLDGETPGAIFTAWLRRFFDYFTSKRPVAAELLEHAGADSPVFGAGRPRVMAAGAPLLAAAQISGEIRDDLTLDQILSLVGAVAKVEGGPTFVEPILRSAFDGLAPAG
jgi:AcrR family transcriptional regulator